VARENHNWLDASGLDLRQRPRNGVAQIINTTGDQILHCGSRAAIRNMLDVHPTRRVEQHAAEMGRRAAASRPERQFR
jgi:hypothetical protein